MQHTESAVKVFSTTDYKRFSIIQGNRQLNQLKIKKIISEIENGNDILQDVPILVSEDKSKLEIIDGQHRFEISKRLKRPVHYIVRSKMTLVGIAKVNTNVERWKSKDFINCYIENGNKHYQQIQQFMEDYDLPVSVSLLLLSRGIIKSDGSKEKLNTQFQNGEFVVKHYKQAVDIAETCKRFGAFEGWNSRPFVVAICKILQSDVCDMDELVEKFQKDEKALLKRGNPKAYLDNLEQIYNKGVHKRRVIY